MGLQEHLKSIGVVCPLLEPLEVTKPTIFGALLEALQAPTAQRVNQSLGVVRRRLTLDVRASARQFSWVPYLRYAICGADSGLAG